LKGNVQRPIKGPCSASFQDTTNLNTKSVYLERLVCQQYLLMMGNLSRLLGLKKKQSWNFFSYQISNIYHVPPDDAVEEQGLVRGNSRNVWIGNYVRA